MEEIKIKEPVGKFIIDNISWDKRFQTHNGVYVHYSDVCTLLKNYHKSKIKELLMDYSYKIQEDKESITIEQQVDTYLMNYDI